MDARNFRVFVEPSAPALGGGYVSYAPELKGCVSDGETPDDALRNIYDAISCWIASAERHDEPVPEPSLAHQFA